MQSQGSLGCSDNGEDFNRCICNSAVNFNIIWVALSRTCRTNGSRTLATKGSGIGPFFDAGATGLTITPVPDAPPRAFHPPWLPPPGVRTSTRCTVWFPVPAATPAPDSFSEDTTLRACESMGLCKALLEFGAVSTAVSWPIARLLFLVSCLLDDRGWGWPTPPGSA